MGSDSIGRTFIKKLKKAQADYDRLVDHDIRAFEVVESPRGPIPQTLPKASSIAPSKDA